MASGPALLVELKIVFVAWVAILSGPDLQARAGIAREDGDGVALAIGTFDVKRMIETAVVGGMEAAVVVAFGAAQELVGRVDAGRFLDEVRVDEEELKG